MYKGECVFVFVSVNVYMHVCVCIYTTLLAEYQWNCLVVYLYFQLVILIGYTSYVYLFVFGILVNQMSACITLFILLWCRLNILFILPYQCLLYWHPEMMFYCASLRTLHCNNSSIKVLRLILYLHQSYCFDRYCLQCVCIIIQDHKQVLHGLGCSGLMVLRTSEY